MELKELKKFIDIEDERLKQRAVGVVDKEKRVLGRMVKLTEEVGELADAILASQGRQRKDKLEAHTHDHLGEEFADVIITAFLLAKSADVDVPKALDDKMKKIDERYMK